MPTISCEEKSEIDEDWKTNLIDSVIIALHKDETANLDEINRRVYYYYTCCAPASIYKFYTARTYNLENIENNRMWYSSPSCFNDPFDCNLAVDGDAIFKSFMRTLPEAKKIHEGSPEWLEFRKIVKEEVDSLRMQLKELRETTGVTCFSESYEEPLMGAHYADNHQGFCVEYNLLEFNKLLSFTAVPVLYSDARPKIHSINHEKPEESIMETFIKGIVTKSPQWRYEREWRIIRDTNACGSSWNADKKGALLECVQPRSIILGCESESDTMHRIMDYCKKNEVNLYRMEKSDTGYEFTKRDILIFDP